MLWWASILKPSHLMIHQVHPEHLWLKPFLHQVQPSTGLHQQIPVEDQSLGTSLKRENSDRNGTVLTTTQHQILIMSSLDLGKVPVMSSEFLLAMKLDLDNHPDHLNQSLLEFRSSHQVLLKVLMLTESQGTLCLCHGGHPGMMVVLRSRVT